MLRTVFEVLGQSTHVQPNIYLDRELPHVGEADAPGITAYRAGLASLLGDRPVKSRAHIEIIRKLDEAAKLFNVLVIKSDMTLPYTSAFLELEGGYWSAAAEGRLREALKEDDDE